MQQQAVDRAASEVQHILSGGKLGTYLSHVPDYQPGMGQAARPMGVAPQHYAPPGQPGFRGSAPGNPYAAVPPPAQASLQVRQSCWAIHAADRCDTSRQSQLWRIF